jgi:hypothetical protein
MRFLLFAVRCVNYQTNRFNRLGEVGQQKPGISRSAAGRAVIFMFSCGQFIFGLRLRAFALSGLCFIRDIREIRG